MSEFNIEAERLNRVRWDEVAPVHARTYDEVRILLEGGITLDDIEQNEIGPVAGKSLLHLQCHIGTDSLSFARLGARVTGVDFSPKSIEIAESLKRQTSLETRFIVSNIYDLSHLLDQQFDIVYTSRGVLCWLRDLDRWARTIHHFLKDNGCFYILEGHPFLNIFDTDASGNGLNIKLPYFHSAQPLKWEGDTDYADPHHVCINAAYEWTWSLSDVINALIRAGLVLEWVHEYNVHFYPQFPGMKTDNNRNWTLPGYEESMPMSFTIKATKH